MYAMNHWHSDGLRWIANVLRDLADFIDRVESSSGSRVAACPSEACNEARAQVRFRAPYY